MCQKRREICAKNSLKNARNRTIVFFKQYSREHAPDPLHVFAHLALAFPLSELNCDAPIVITWLHVTKLIFLSLLLIGSTMVIWERSLNIVPSIGRKYTWKECICALAKRIYLK